MANPAVEAPERVDHSGMTDFPSSFGESTPFLEQFSFRPCEFVIKRVKTGDRPGDAIVVVARERVTSASQREPVGEPWEVTRDQLEEGLKHLCFNQGRLRCQDGTFLERGWAEDNLATVRRTLERYGS
jgi:hypothetical protein